MNRVLIIGGPGTISTSTIAALAEGGSDITLFTRPKAQPPGVPDGVKLVYGDRNDADALGAAIGDARPDVTIDFICFTPEQATAAAIAARGNTGQFIFVSTCDVAGYPLSRLPYRESDPSGELRSRYAADKRRCEEIFLKAAGQKVFDLTIPRPSYSMGPKFALSAFSRAGGRDIVSRLRAGRPIVVPGDGTTLMHASAAHNTGQMIARMVGDSRAAGKTYTCGHHCATTGDDYVRLFGAVLGVEPEIVHIPTDLLIRWGSEEETDGLLSELTRYNVQFSMGAFLSDFPDFVWERKLEDAVAGYIEHQDRQGAIPGEPAPGFEEKALGLWRERVGV